MSCNHPEHKAVYIDNGGCYCGVCFETNLQHRRVLDENNNVAFEGSYWACVKFMEKKEFNEDKVEEFDSITVNLREREGAVFCDSYTIIDHNKGTVSIWAKSKKLYNEIKKMFKND